MKKSILISTILLLLIFNVSLCKADQHGPSNSSLAAFSLAAAQMRIKTSPDQVSDEIKYAGYITHVWAVVVQASDLIIIGERDFSRAPMLLDDIVVALRSTASIASGDNPGVSIVPAVTDRYSPTQRVVYFGNIENTHYGMVCVLSDYLLKAMSASVISSNIKGLPSEWDLTMDNTKAQRIVAPWQHGLGLSWIYPHRVVISAHDNVAVLSGVNIGVRTDFNNELPILEEYYDLNDPDRISAVLEKIPFLSGQLAASLLSQSYDEISITHKVFGQTKNLIGLSGLLSKVIDGDVKIRLKYWFEEYAVTHYETPVEVPTLDQTELGLAYSLSVSGGIETEFVPPDAWSELVIGRNAQLLREAAMIARPDKDSVSWQVPVELGHPENWSQQKLDLLQSKEADRISQYLEEPNLYNENLLNHAKTYVATDPIQNWSPSTEGKHMLSLAVDLEINIGNYETYSRNRTASIAQSDLELGFPISMTWIYNNTFGLELEVPIIYRLYTEDRPTNLPGIGESVVAYAAGVESPRLINRIVLSDGVKNRRWINPYIVLENTLIYPKHKIWSQGFYEGEEYVESGQNGQNTFNFDFGTKSKIFIHNLSAVFPTEFNYRFGLFARYNNVKLPELEGHDDSKLFGASWEWQFSPQTSDKLIVSIANQSGKTNGNWEKEGQIFRLSLKSPGAEGSNRISIGWFKPTDKLDNHGGSFFMTFDLSGTSIWKGRKWF